MKPNTELLETAKKYFIRTGCSVGELEMIFNIPHHFANKAINQVIKEASEEMMDKKTPSSNYLGKRTEDGKVYNYYKSMAWN